MQAHSDIVRLAGASARRRRNVRMPFLAVALGFAVAGTAATVAVDAVLPDSETPLAAGAPAATHIARFEPCGAGARITCVIDGDTIWFEGVKIRLADIDAPEISEPRCAGEAALGRRATRRLVALVNEGPFEIAREDWPDKDRYGRRLRVLRRDGVSLGETLVAEGLAVRWGNGRPDWC